MLQVVFVNVADRHIRRGAAHGRLDCWVGAVVIAKTVSIAAGVMARNHEVDVTSHLPAAHHRTSAAAHRGGGRVGRVRVRPVHGQAGTPAAGVAAHCRLIGDHKVVGYVGVECAQPAGAFRVPNRTNAGAAGSVAVICRRAVLGRAVIDAAVIWQPHPTCDICLGLAGAGGRVAVLVNRAGVGGRAGVESFVKAGVSAGQRSLGSAGAIGDVTGVICGAVAGGRAEV